MNHSSSILIQRKQGNQCGITAPIHQQLQSLVLSAVTLSLHEVVHAELLDVVTINSIQYSSALKTLDHTAVSSG